MTFSFRLLPINLKGDHYSMSEIGYRQNLQIKALGKALGNGATNPQSCGGLEDFAGKEKKINL
jgi:hypothetical protein